MLDLSKYEGHTPGPWTVCEFADANEAAVEDGGWEWANGVAPLNEPVGSVWRDCGDGVTTGLPGSIETTLANASLIADAPALLDELKALRKSHAKLLVAAKIGCGYVEATEQSLPTRPNIVTKDADVIREAIKQAEVL